MSRIMTIILFISIILFSYVVSKEVSIFYKLASLNVLLFAILSFLIIMTNDEE